MLDLSGNLVCSGVEKEANDERIVRIISSVGRPSVIASDTSPPSSFVQKVAARFHTKLFHPKKSLTQEEKRTIGKNINDPHVRDAYAAAVKAFRRYADRLRQIDNMDLDNIEILSRGRDRRSRNVDDHDSLKHLIIKGEPIGKRLKGK